MVAPMTSPPKYAQTGPTSIKSIMIIYTRSHQCLKHVFAFLNWYALIDTSFQNWQSCSKNTLCKQYFKLDPQVQQKWYWQT